MLRPPLGRLRQHAPVPLHVPAAYRARRAGRDAPAISIVTPSFNAAPFIEHTIRSVIEQRYPALQYIVQDGGSSDGTVEAIRRFAGAIARIDSARDHGQADAINRGFAHASGDVLAYLNADDLLLPGALDYVGAWFATHPDVDVIYGHRVLVDEAGREIGRWVLPPHDAEVVRWADYIPQETMFWRRRAWDAIGSRLDPTFQFAMDWDLIVRLSAAGARFVRVPRFLGAFRVHAGQKTTALQETGAGEMARIRERLHGVPITAAAISRHVRGYLIRHLGYHLLYRAGVLRY